jgi:hypothetical protein
MFGRKRRRAAIKQAEADAAALIARFGNDACDEARQRARRSQGDALLSRAGKRSVFAAASRAPCPRCQAQSRRAVER